MELADLQSLLYRLITAPTGVEEGLRRENALGPQGLDGLIRGDERLSAGERLAIYADAFFYRVLDVCKEDFPATLAVLGDLDFHNLITGYLIDYPPTEPSIVHAGRYLPNFIAGHSIAQRLPFITDLATLERLLVEIFHAPDATPLTTADMNAIPPEDWPAIALRRHPASCLLDLRWDVAKILRAVERNGRWDAPRAATTVQILVSRCDGKVVYRELEADEHAALRLAENGVTFAAMCEAAASVIDESDPTTRIGVLLSRWLNGQILIRDHSLPPSPT